MVTTKDNDLNILKEGMRVTEFLRNSSSSIFFEELKKLQLIKIDPNQRVYLTEKGQVAKKIGIEKYVELEEFEKELTEDPEEVYLRNKLLLLCLCVLNLLLIAVLIYIYIRASEIYYYY